MERWTSDPKVGGSGAGQSGISRRLKMDLLIQKVADKMDEKWDAGH